MKPEELDLLIKEGEGLSVEFKEKYTTKIDRDMVAFSNTKGGYIFLGVCDDGKIVGEALTNKLKAEIVDLARNCEPNIHLKRISQVDKIIFIEIAEGEEKPYSCSSGYFRRLDAVTQKMTQKEIHLLFRDAPSVSFEERINKDITWKDISTTKIGAFFKEADVSIKSINAQEVLSSLNLSNKHAIKNAGVLFFAKEPRSFIIQCQMTLVAFKGKDRVHIYDRKDIQDDLLTQFNEAIIFLEKHLNVRTEIKGVKRQDIYELPFEALREAVTNAIIHRDYSVRGTSIMVEVHEDKVVISNPGGFPAEMDKTKLGKLSVRRNELIADIFARMDKVERVGSGFRRIKEALDDANLPFPEIESDSFFIITFKRPPYSLKGSEKSVKRSTVTGTENSTVKVTVKQEAILAVMRENPNITSKQLVALVGLSERRIKENIRILKENGLLKRIGSDKSGHWEVTQRSS
jgi:ATP-dependent DNA helicase RecG